MSRVDELPTAPRLRGAFATALRDFYEHAWRLVASNVIWGLGLLGLWFVGLVWPFGSIIFAPLLALPTVGLFRMAALIVRGEPVSIRSGLAAWGSELGPALGAGVAAVGAVIVFGSNLVVGLLSSEPLGWALATFAGWALVTTWVVGLAFWPILADPLRAGRPVRRRVRLAGLLVLAHPMRLAGLGVGLGMVGVVSVIAFAALLTISIAYGALVVCRYVLPASDRLEARLTAGSPTAGSPTAGSAEPRRTRR